MLRRKVAGFSLPEVLVALALLVLAALLGEQLLWMGRQRLDNARQHAQALQWAEQELERLRVNTVLSGYPAGTPVWNRECVTSASSV